MTNMGYTWRKDRAKESKSIEMHGRPVDGLFQQNRLIPPNNDISMRFRRNCDAFVLKGPALAAAVTTFPYAIVMEEVVFYPYKVIVNPEIHTRHLLEFSKGQNALYPLRYSDVKSFAMPAGSLNFVSQTVFTGKLPELLIFSMVESLGYSGTFHKDPFNFRDFGLSGIPLSVNNEVVIFRNLDIDVANNKMILAYNTMFSAVSSTQLGNNISFFDFRNGSFFLAFDFQNSNLGNRFNAIKDGEIKFELKFKSALTLSVHAIVLGQFQGIMSLDHQRQVQLDLY